MWIIAKKEFRELLYSPKFLVISLCSLALVLVSLFTGYAVFESEKKAQAIGQRIAEEDIRTTRGNYAASGYTQLENSWMMLYRPPERLAIFDIGISGVLGRASSTLSAGKRTMENSRYSRDPALALFGELDLTFISSFIFSLFALLFSYDAVTGERERGTLQLIMANCNSRAALITGKLCGLYIPLALVLLVPLLLGLAIMLTTTDLSFTADEWARIGIMVFAALLYLLVFLSVGLAVSSLTRASLTSFAVCLLAWVLSVAVVPKVMGHLASLVMPPMSQTELTKRSRAFWDKSRGEEGPFFKDYFDNHPMSFDEYQKRRREIRDLYVEARTAQRERFEQDLFDELQRRRLATMARIAEFARISPTSSFELSMHALAVTGPRLMEVFSAGVEAFRREYEAFVEGVLARHADDEESSSQREWIEETDGSGRIRLVKNEKYIARLDLPDLPRFRMVLPDVVDLSGDALQYLLILGLQAILFFALAVVAFFKYDVR